MRSQMRFLLWHDAFEKAARSFDLAVKLEKRRKKIFSKHNPDTGTPNVGGIDLVEIGLICDALVDSGVMAMMTVFGLGEGNEQIADNAELREVHNRLLKRAASATGIPEEEAVALISQLRAYRNEVVAHTDANRFSDVSLEQGEGPIEWRGKYKRKVDRPLSARLSRLAGACAQEALSLATP